MTYGTFTTIKQALEALNLRESVIIQVTNGVVDIFDKEAYIDNVKDEWEDELRGEIYQNAYDDGHTDGFNEGKQVARILDQSDL